LRGVRALCDKHGIMMIADEIQSGFGRTGRWFAHTHFGVTPDIMTVAKGLASGLPLSGVFSRQDLMKKWLTGSHGGTYGGNPVAAASAVATIQTIRDERLLENAQARGAQLMGRLRRLQKDYPVLGDVRGLGLMVGAEFRNPADRKPDKATTKAIVNACFEKHLLLLNCGPWDNVIRWIPPLIVTEKQIDEAVEIFEGALKEVVK
jgi:4-aminobutyrate aminotransferase